LGDRIIVDPHSADAKLMAELRQHFSKEQICGNPLFTSAWTLNAAIGVRLASLDGTTPKPQREQKTYEEYRLVLYGNGARTDTIRWRLLRDTCGKSYLQEINRDECLSARTC
jgi:hypothetical protein